MNNILKAFIIMPFGLEFDMIYSGLIKPPLEEVGYEVCRADSILDQQNILKDIVRKIAEADLIIADLTSINPNVFYELGIAHAMLVPTVLLTQSMDDVPFDLKSYRVIQYSTSYFNAEELPNRLKEIADNAKKNNLSFGNPVSDFLPKGRIKEISIDKNITDEKEKGKSIDLEEEKGLWDFLVDAEKSIEIIGNITFKISDETRIIGEKVEIKTGEFTQINNSSVPGTASRIQKLISNTAFEIINYSNNIKELQPQFHNAWVDLDDNMVGLLKTVEIKNDKDQKTTIEFKKNITELKKAILLSLEEITKFRNSINNLKGQSRELNLASRTAVTILDLLLSDLQGAEAYTIKIIDLIDEKLKAF